MKISTNEDSMQTPASAEHMKNREQSKLTKNYAPWYRALSFNVSEKQNASQ